MCHRSDRGWLKPSDAAKYAGVSLKVFRRWMRNGLKPASVQVGERQRKRGEVEPIYRHFIHYDDVDEWMEKHRQGDSPEEQLAKELLEGILK